MQILMENLDSKSRYTYVLKSSLPIIISYLSIQILGITDMIMVGTLGADAVAAVGVATTLFMLISRPLEGLFDSSLILLSKAYGTRNNFKFRELLHHLILMAVILSFGGILLIPLLNFILGFMSPTELVYFQGSKYLFYIMLSLMPFLINWIITKSLISINRNKVLAHVSNAALIINIILNYMFIFGKLGAPEMGVAGSALATLITRSIQCIFLLFYCKKINEEVVPTDYKFKFSKETIKEIIDLGLPIGQTNLLEIGAWTLFVSVISTLGVNALAAHQIAMKIKDIAFMPGFALSNIATSMVGIGVGQNNYKETMIAHSVVSRVTVGIMGIIGVILFIFPEFFLGFFTTDIEVIAIGKTLLNILVVYQIIDGIWIVLRGSMNGLGATSIVRNTVLVGAWGLMLPVSYMLTKYTSVGVLGAWIGLSINVLFSGIVLSYFFRKIHKEKTEAIYAK